MRSIFDQYSQPENRLTHALASSLYEDRYLLGHFVKWATGSGYLPKGPLRIVEQSLPGLEDLTEEEASKKGLPDAWIYSDEGWALLIESKVASKLTIDQLGRHARTAKARGFTDVRVLAIVADRKDLKSNLPARMFTKSWSDVYQWAVKHSSQSKWAIQLLSYMEVAETKMIDQGYLKDGKLTTFAGIDFNADKPYVYIEAKRILGLILDELKTDTDFTRELGINPKLDGRGAITGRDALGVWDFLRLKESKDAGFTKYPHLTVFISAECVSAAITVPNGMSRKTRRRMLGEDYEVFERQMRCVLDAMNSVWRIDKSVKPVVNLVQRHYKSQRSSPIHDARLYCDLRTALISGKESAEKYQPQCLRAIFEMLSDKKSNLQLQVGAEVFYRHSKVIQTPKAIDLIKQTFVALKPVLVSFRGALKKK